MAKYKKKVITKIEAFYYDSSVNRATIITGLLKLGDNVIININGNNTTYEITINGVPITLDRYIYIDEVGTVVQRNALDFEAEYTEVV